MKYNKIFYAVLLAISFKSAYATQQSDTPHCEVYLVRHGQTDWNVAQRIQGHTDIPLNALGEAQARKLANDLKDISFAATYSSDLSRARKTASIVSGRPESQIATHPFLRERRMGCFEGRSLNEQDVITMIASLRANGNSQEAFMSWRADEEAETDAEVYARLEGFLKTLPLVHPGERVLVASHSGVLTALLFRMDFRPARYWRAANCAHIRLRIEANKINILEMAGVELVANW